MKIEIKTPETKLVFEMERKDVLSVVRLAMRYATAAEDKAAEASPRPAAQERQVMKPQPEAIPAAPARQSRVETMFGAKREWDMPAQIKRPAARQETERKGWYGFLYVRCGACGHERGFCSKTPITDSRCSCGLRTELKDMRPAHVRCQCGGSFTYNTNIKDYGFTMNCLNCGNEVPLMLNDRETAYVTIGRNLVTL